MGGAICLGWTVDPGELGEALRREISLKASHEHYSSGHFLQDGPVLSFYFFAPGIHELFRKNSIYINGSTYLFQIRLQL
jgi:hypothetical protein